MKKVLLFLCLSVSAYSQIVVGEYRMFDESPDKNKPEAITLLKTKKTLFILPSSFSQEEYAAVIAQVWDITPFEIVEVNTFKEMPDEQRNAKYSAKNYAFFKLSSMKYTRTTKSGATVDYLFNTLDLSVFEYKKTDKKGKDVFDGYKLATIFFSPNIDQRQKEVAAVNPRLFLNFDLGYLRTYLKIVNDKLKSNGFTNCYDDFYNKVSLKNLKTNKLYIPESIGIKYNAFSRTEGKKREESELLEDYKFPYEIVTEEKLNELLTSGQEIYFLNYVQVNGNKLISVINSKTGEILYNSKTGLSYNIKDGDFKSISKKIDD
ncbi:hypothetical protein [Flavobacterium sedimenticola]|uniref:Uncharacterized protein n=1 Tax=Flavobacterium sedimenticola TaxID=3043286 RepID=A0ABT6XM82_9FLAO|nr:hypothetical protein [Flavobacterium sedimenticola]MDI9256080.1 hypothetical protein [Flavobacterium sedimenticola]